MYADNNKDDDNVYHWFNWKVKHLDNEEQKNIIKYFEEINNLFEEAKKTEYKNEESDWGYPDPNEAVETVKNIIKESKRIVPPKFCAKHYTITLKILSIIEEYQNERVKAGTDKMFEAARSSNEAYEIKLREAKLNELGLEEERQKEYFRILHKIGFYNSALNEMLNLRLITKDQKEKLERK